MWRLAAVPILCLLPGAWIAFALKRMSIGRWPRTAIAVALSPIVVVVEYYALRAWGLSFDRAAMLMPLINAPALLLVVRAWRSMPLETTRASAGAVWGVIAVCLACIALPWIVDPIFRKLSWHGLMHADVCYAIARGALIPEEPEMAGVRLVYPWFGHIYWAVMAWSGGISPTQVYMVTNLVWALVTGVFCYAACRELGGSALVSLSCPVLVALGPNLLGVVGWSIIPPNDSGAWWAILGDLRYAPFVQKYVSFEAMPFGLALYSAMLLAAIVCLMRTSRFLLTLIPVMLVAVAGLYPNVFPAAAVIAAAAPITLLFFPSMSSATYTRKFLILQIVLAAVAFGAGLVLIKFFTAGREGGMLAISDVPAAGKKTIAATLALGPFVVLAWVLWRRQIKEKRGPLLVCAAAVAAAVAFNIALRLDGLNEYKFFMCAGLAIAPPAVVGAEHLWLRYQRRRPILLFFLLTGLAAVMTAYSAHRIPDNAKVKPETESRGFYLSLAPSKPDAAWTNAVRERTPTDTLLVVYKPAVHVSSFCARSMWITSEADSMHCGYNMFTRFHLLNVRGYKAALFDHRWDILERVYLSRDPDGAAILGELSAMNRPIALVFDAEHSLAFLDWLRDHRIGETIFESTDGRTVRLINPPGA